MKKTLLIITMIALMLLPIGCGKENTEGNDSKGTNSDKTDTSSASSGSFGSSSLKSFEFSSVKPYTVNEDVNVDIKSLISINLDNLTNEDAEKAEQLTESELKSITAKKTKLLKALSTAFKNAGLNVDINSNSGEVSLNSSVLFSGDSAALTSRGKDFLKQFVKTYSSVMLSEEYEGFISKIRVEGHTAPLSGSTYESGLPLSKERANNVKSYCLSSEIGISSSEISKLSSVMEAVGMSNSRPVKTESGKVDIAASRRVSFRFFINLNK